MTEPAKGRRLFISKLSYALIGTTILSSQLSYAFITNTDAPFEGYEPCLDDTTDLRSFNSPDKTLNIIGTVYGKDGLSLKPNARIEVWHLSPGSSEYDHRGAFNSSANGAYAFRTELPNRMKGKMPRIFFKISHEGSVVYTELILNTHKAYISHEHWENHKSLKERLFPIDKNNGLEREIQFNVTV